MRRDEKRKMQPKEEKVNKNFVFAYEKGIELSCSARETWGDFTAQCCIRFHPCVSLK